jgi:hypothetical protein
MAEDFLKGIGYFIDPSIKNRFGPVIKGAADLFRTPDPKKSYKRLMTTGANVNRTAVLGNYLSDLLAFGLDAGGIKGASAISKLSKVGAKGGKYLDDIIKNYTTPLNKVLAKIGDEKIATMTNRELTEYINKNHGLNVKLGTIANKKLNTISQQGLGKQKLKEAFESIDNPEQYSVDELLALPAIKKVVTENSINKNLFSKYKSDFGITQTKKRRTKPFFMDEANVDESKVIEFVKKNPSATNTQIQAKFPKLKNTPTGTIQNWRTKNNLKIVSLKRINKTILEANNPKLQAKLDFVPKGSTTPIKHKDAFSEVVTINKKYGPLDMIRTKIVQAHGIGEGGISKASEQIIKSKVAMIPNKFLKDEKLPQFFLTRSGNTTHRAIENNLVLALVKKYKLLGHEFVDGSWKQVRKSKILNPKKRIEIKKLENEISGYQNELNDLDAYTLFYNPVKDKMVTHGKSLSDIPGLSNLLNQVQSGTKKLRYGGLVGIGHLTRPLGNF